MASFPELIPPNDPELFQQLVDTMASTVKSNGHAFYLGFSYHPDTEHRTTAPDPNQHFDDYPNDPVHIEGHSGFHTPYDLNWQDLPRQGVTPVIAGSYRSFPISRIDGPKHVDVWHFNEAMRQRYARIGEISVKSWPMESSHRTANTTRIYWVESAGIVRTKTLLQPESDDRQLIDHEVLELTTYFED